MYSGIPLNHKPRINKYFERKREFLRERHCFVLICLGQSMRKGEMERDFSFIESWRHGEAPLNPSLILFMTGCLFYLLISPHDSHRNEVRKMCWESTLTRLREGIRNKKGNILFWQTFKAHAHGTAYVDLSFMDQEPSAGSFINYVGLHFFY